MIKQADSKIESDHMDELLEAQTQARAEIITNKILNFDWKYWADSNPETAQKVALLEDII
jgi:hypothetical protein